MATPFFQKAQIQKPAPDFSGPAVVDGQIKDIKLSDFKGKYCVLFFYPLDWTFVCPTEIVAFSDAMDKFKAADCAVIGCSVDSEFSHLRWVQCDKKQGGIAGCNYPLLSDKTHQIAKDYGVFIEDGPDAGVSLRGAFIIDPKGILRQMTINDLPVGRNPEEVLRLVQAFQFTDKHGEVCPASWKPGSKTMKDDPVKSLDYFKNI
mmetsp:Transcript_27105/g.68769  ORF Transcript_27105/g.68769 Transcript_27105/m.68769 type:complete len:204 (-) Transcript_27105:256-867(-)